MRRIQRMMSAFVAAVACHMAVACGGGSGGTGSSGGGSSSSSSSPAAATMTIHYKRIAGDYAGWGLHLWNDAGGVAAVSDAVATSWIAPRSFDDVTDGWAKATIPLVNANSNLNFLIRKGDAKSPALDMSVNRLSFGADVWVVQETGTLYATKAAAETAAARIGHQADGFDTSVPIGDTASALPANWNKRAQFMEIFVRSYKDSDGDGQGDLRGLISKLDYLQSLGVTGLWLMPVFESQDSDHGYAVMDYRAIERDYGTLADFDELITQAHARGIGIVLDYVMNHSAAQNPLYLDAISSPTNARRDWYIFSATDPGWAGFSGPSWRPTAYGYAYGLFSDIMPDFNLQNPAVIDWHMDNLRFWLNRGVDGFRFDAVETFVENGSTAWYNQPENHIILAQAQNTINAYSNRFMVCEAPDHSTDYAQASSCGKAFAFGRQEDIKTSVTSGMTTPGLAAYLLSGNRSNLLLFLSNHDSFSGNRPISALGGHSEADYHLAAAIALLASDTPFAYYGEEVGMSGNGEAGDAGLRAPMSWSNVITDFTSGTPYRAQATNLATHNVAAQTGVTGSLLETYRSLYAVRSGNPLLQTGELALLSSAGEPRIVFLRQTGSERALVMINLQSSAQSISANTGLVSTVFGVIYPTLGGTVTSTASGTVTLSVPAQGVVILRTR